MKSGENFLNTITSMAMGGYIPRKTYHEIMRRSLMQSDYFVNEQIIKELNDLISRIERIWDNSPI